MLDIKLWTANIEKRATKLFDSPADEYLDDLFISNNTDFTDLMELCNEMKSFIIRNRGILPAEVSKEQFFNKYTKFNSWEDMLSAATDHYER